LVTDAKPPNAPEGLKSDLKAVLQWLEVKRPEDIGAKQHQLWARGFEQYLMEGKAPCPELSRSFNFFREQVEGIYQPATRFDKPVTEEMRAVYDQMLAFDEDISLPRPEKKPTPVALPPPPPAKPGAPINASQSVAETAEAPERAAPAIKVPAITAPVVKGILGFVTGFVSVFCLEALLFAGGGILSGQLLRSVGPGWFVMPIAAGIGGWIVFRNPDTAKAGLKYLVADLRSWRREYQIALAVAFAIGWIVGVVLGFFMSTAGRAPEYYPPTFATWILGSSQYFPLAGLASGLTGGLVGAAIIYVRKLLRSGEASLGSKAEDDIVAEIKRARANAATQPEATIVPRSSPHRGFQPPAAKN
jgi:hypothetical protein